MHTIEGLEASKVLDLLSHSHKGRMTGFFYSWRWQGACLTTMHAFSEGHHTLDHYAKVGPLTRRPFLVR